MRAPKAGQRTGPSATTDQPKKRTPPLSGGVSPSEYTPEQRAAIHALVCEQIAAGLSGRKACEIVGVPRGLWAKWVVTGLVDGSQYTHAREMCADVHGEGIVEAAETLGLTDPQYARVVVDAKKWTAARMFPKRWGDKLDVTTAGEKIELAPVVILPPQGDG